jgi:hypothetical protein
VAAIFLYSWLIKSLAWLAVYVGQQMQYRNISIPYLCYLEDVNQERLLTAIPVMLCVCVPEDRGGRWDVW